MKTTFAFIIAFTFFSCGNSGTKAPVVVKKDSLSARDSMKKALTDNLPPASDLSQFEWFYSIFTQAAVEGNVGNFNKFIHPTYGLWVIHAEGAPPEFSHVMNIADFKLPGGKFLLPMNDELKSDVPKDEGLPSIDCSSKTLYSKTGCFTQELNLFAGNKIWLAAGLSADDDKAIAQLASTITRTVINTSCHCTFYFSLINGTWYLTFLDIRKPCEA